MLRVTPRAPVARAAVSGAGLVEHGAPRGSQRLPRSCSSAASRISSIWSRRPHPCVSAMRAASSPTRCGVAAGVRVACVDSASRGWLPPGSGPPGRGRLRDAATPPARPRPGDRRAPGSCRAPSPSRARSRRVGSARRGRRPWYRIGRNAGADGDRADVFEHRVLRRARRSSSRRRARAALVVARQQHARTRRRRAGTPRRPAEAACGDLSRARHRRRDARSGR